MTWDLFISHASEDKDEVARPLANMLQAKGFKVWYDEYTLTLGDNLRHSIEQGLAQSEFGIVVLSPSFFAKKWTNLELDGLFALEKLGEKRILPIWHNVNAGDVERYSSFLAMRLGVPTSKGLDHIVQQIQLAVERERGRDAQSTEALCLAIHPHAVALLLAAQESNGTIMAVRHLGGYSVQAGSRSFGADGDPRAEALNVHCLNELIVSGFAEQRSDSLFVLTQKGFEFQPPTELLQARTPAFPSISAGNVEASKEIMRAAVAGDGRILSLAHLSGHVLQAGSQRVDSCGDRRKEAHWKSVLNELLAVGLITQMSNEVYDVSHIGYLWTDELNVREQQTGGSGATGA